MRKGHYLRRIDHFWPLIRPLSDGRRESAVDAMPASRAMHATVRTMTIGMTHALQQSLLTPTDASRYSLPPPQPTVTVHERKRYEVASHRTEIAPREYSAPSVLIVDASRESREVLRMLLELRGATTIEAERPGSRPSSWPTPCTRSYRARCRKRPQRQRRRRRTISAKRPDRNHTPIVILGKVRQLHGSPISADKSWPSPTIMGHSSVK